MQWEHLGTPAVLHAAPEKDEHEANRLYRNLQMSFISLQAIYTHYFTSISNPALVALGFSITISMVRDVTIAASSTGSSALLKRVKECR